ncbi:MULTISPECIES: glycosyltransferase family 2 protein [Chitinophagaceae]
MNTPTISVVIPCFNDGVYLQETLDRLNEQTYKDFEVIIVNDGSTDRATLIKLEEISQQGQAIVYHIPNSKMSAARNYAITRSQGKIIVALDADDYFDKSFFGKALQYLDANKDAAVVSCYVQHFGLDKKVFKPRGGTVKNFLFSNQCPMCSMFRKDVWEQVGGLDENMKEGYEDWDFFLSITALGYRIKILPEILFYYRQTKKSTLKNQTEPNQEKLLNYMLAKHSDLYRKELKELIKDKQVLYTESRISWQQIIKMIRNRIVGKYK